MTFHLEIDTSGSDFTAMGGAPSEDDRNTVVANLLIGAAKKLRDGRTEFAVMDSNGNRIGSAWYEENE